MKPRLRRTVNAALVVATIILPVPAESIHASSVASPFSGQQHTMLVHGRGFLSTAQADAVALAAAAVGAVGHRMHTPTIAMTARERRGRTIWRAVGRRRIPMVSIVASRAYVRSLGGAGLLDALAAGSVAVGTVTAERLSIRVGDVLELRDRKNRKRPLRVGAIVEQRLVEGGDLLITTETAKPRFGAMPIKQMVITDIPTPEAVIDALSLRGVRQGTKWRIRTSWDPPDPDAVLESSELARHFGQLSYVESSGRSMSVMPSYSRRMRRVLYSGVELRQRCHARVVGAIQSALTEISAAGLASRINTVNSNRYGGCFVSRYARRQGNYPALSRHAWGVAFDVNTVANAQGKVPVLDCDVVRIMRRWGFAWGGNFLLPDGMHFEWAGGRRDLLGYPSRYCPNLVPVPVVERPVFPGDPPPTTSTTSTTTSTTTSSTTSTTTTLPVDDTETEESLVP